MKNVQCLICGGALSGRQTKFCSIACNSSFWYLKNKERKLSHQAERYKTEPVFRIKRKQQSRNHRLAQRGLTLEAYENMFINQKGLCAICSNPERSLDWKNGQLKRLAIDHNHLTGKNRLLLCGLCNTALGKFGDSILVLEKAIAYLRSCGESL